jgi:aspartate aminotransferase
MDQSLISRILSKGVVIVPGSAFGKNAPDYARLSYAAPRNILEEAILRIQSAL